MNENDLKLSYIITTRNKLLSLREVLSRLVKERRPDEEIIVVDGASEDGTVDYLRSLYESGQIQQFISEPDVGEAHGYNKGLLMARGELIKCITDDDAFYWPGIRSCKEFMLSHPEVDILGTNGGGTSLSKTSNLSAEYIYDEKYNKWKSLSIPIEFCGLGIMIRRNSLPLIGLFNANIVRVDYEFSLRATSGSANLAWYTGLVWVRVLNPISNVITQRLKIDLDTRKLNQFYWRINHEKSVINDFFDLIGNYTGKMKKLPVKAVRFLAKKLGYISQQVNQPAGKDYSAKDWGIVFEMCYQWLKEEDKKNNWKFITKYTGS